MSKKRKEVTEDVIRQWEATNYLTFTNPGRVLAVDLCDPCSAGRFEKGLPELLKELLTRISPV